jgi:hypothetical protein
LSSLPLSPPSLSPLRLIGSLKSILETNQEAYAKYMDGIVVDEDCEEEEEKDSDAGSPVIGSRKHK